MRQTTLFLLLLLLVTGWGPCQGQALPVVQPVTGGFPFITEWIQQLSQRLVLPDLRLTPTAEHIRLFTTATVLDFWHTPAGKFQGQMFVWTEEAGTPTPTHRLYSQTYPLPASTVQRLFTLADSTHILTLPTEEAIAKWKATLDGRSYTLEHTGVQGYQVQSWANPDLQESLPEAVRVSTFFTHALALVVDSARSQAFSDSIPFACYSNNGGASVACRISAMAPRKQRARPKRNREAAAP